MKRNTAMKMLSLKQVVFLITVAFSFGAQAGPDANSQPTWLPDDMLFTFPESNPAPAADPSTAAAEIEVAAPGDAQNPAPPPEGLTLVYDPEALGSATDEEKARLHGEFVEEIRKQARKERVFSVRVPLAPSSLEALATYQNLSESEKTQFLVKKQAFLEGVADFLRRFKVSEKKVATAMSAINDQFFVNAKAIANSNAQGLNIEITLSGGFGIRSQLLTGLRTSRFGKVLPQAGGFGLMLGGGLSFVNVTMPNGEQNLYIEISHEYKLVSKIKTFVAMLNADLSVGGLITNVDLGPGTKVKEVRGIYGGPAAMRGGSQHVVVELAGGPSLIPVVGMFAAYEAEGKRRSLALLNIEKLRPKGTQEYVYQTLHRTRSAILRSIGKPICEDLFSSPNP